VFGECSSRGQSLRYAPVGGADHGTGGIARDGRGLETIVAREPRQAHTRGSAVT
jgi:hypothetical protein